MIPLGGFDSVIRIGHVPTLRYWRDLEQTQLPVVHFDDLPFRGMTRGDVHPIASLPARVSANDRDEDFFARDRELAGALQSILDEEPRSEAAMIRDVSLSIPEGSRVYLGNSLPIREWDLTATRQPRGFSIEANRGANGIDGQLSTFCDLGAPWIVRQMRDVRFRIVIVNNRGGRIFGRVASLRQIDANVRERLIENSHDLSFDRWTEMWGLGARVHELRPDADASARVWKRYEELWS
jgi:2-succinyl-5-enolpyruvyl-6-hydroxy-3-cyclohexene-1-carboxylate synthase